MGTHSKPLHLKATSRLWSCWSKRALMSTPKLESMGTHSKPLHLKATSRLWGWWLRKMRWERFSTRFITWSASYEYAALPSALNNTTILCNHGSDFACVVQNAVEIFLNVHSIVSVFSMQVNWWAFPVNNILLASVHFVQPWGHFVSMAFFLIYSGRLNESKIQSKIRNIN